MRKCPATAQLNQRTILFLQPQVLDSLTTGSGGEKCLAPRQIKTRTGCMQCKREESNATKPRLAVTDAWREKKHAPGNHSLGNGREGQ
jgi:hypothetical protein